MAYIQERTNAKGEKVYLIKVSSGYSTDGKQITQSKTYKPESKMTPRQIRKEVERQAVLFENEVRGNTAAKRHDKFEVIAEEWLRFEQEHDRIKLSTVELYKGMCRRIYKSLGHFHIDKITKVHIQRFIDSLANGTDGYKKLSAKSQKNYLCFIANVFTYAMDNDIVSSNPCHNIRFEKSPKTKRERRFYTVEEEVELLERLEQRNAPLVYRLFYSLVMYLGLRKGEALGIQWNDIYFDKKSVYIHTQIQYRNKNTGAYRCSLKTEGSERTLQLPPKIIDLLMLVRAEQEENRAKCGDLWVDTDSVITNWCGKFIFPSQPYNYLKDFCERENLPFKAIHSFRHSLVTNLIHNNVDVATVSSIVGHSSPLVTLSVYTHEIKSATVIGCEQMADLIDRAAANGQNNKPAKQ